MCQFGIKFGQGAGETKRERFFNVQIRLISARSERADAMLVESEENIELR